MLGRTTGPKGTPTPFFCLFLRYPSLARRTGEGEAQRTQDDGTQAGFHGGVLDLGGPWKWLAALVSTAEKLKLWL